MARKGVPVQSIDRVFDIMEKLSTHSRGILLTELAAEVSLPKSTVYRLLVSLTNKGYAVKESDNGKYRLTMRLFEIGSRAAGVRDMLATIRPCLDQLAETTGEVVHFVKRDGGSVIYIYKLDTSSASVRMTSAVGVRNPMYCTGVGKAILSHLPEAEALAIWNATDIRRHTEQTITTFARMEQEMKCIAQNGYALDNEEHELGVCCVAAPVYDYSDRPAYAVSVSAPSTRMNEQRIQIIAPMIIRVATEISRLLGATPKTDGPW